MSHLFEGFFTETGYQLSEDYVVVGPALEQVGLLLLLEQELVCPCAQFVDGCLDEEVCGVGV
jgi:hypothetical protein